MPLTRSQMVKLNRISTNNNCQRKELRTLKPGNFIWPDGTKRTKRCLWSILKDMCKLHFRSDEANPGRNGKGISKIVQVNFD